MNQKENMAGAKIVKQAWGKLRRTLLGAAIALIGALQPAAGQQVDTMDAPRDITIGILASEGITRALDSWLPMAAALNTAAQGAQLNYRFKIAPYTDATMINKISQGALDFFLVDPAAFVVAEVESNARPLLSVAQMWEGQVYDKTSVVVFTTADSDIRAIPDIAGRSIMGVSADEMTGWKLALQEFRKYRLDIDDIASRALFSGGNQREVVYAVQAGLVDVGVVRAGVLEGLARDGVIDMNDFRPVSPVDHPGYPFWASTMSYPDWVLGTIPGVPQAALTILVDTLLGQDTGSPEAIAAGGTVWLPPQNYQSVHELLISLRARPYENYLQRSALRIASTYKWLVLGTLLLIVFSLLFLIFQLRENARQAHARKDVLKSEVRSKQFYRNAVEAHTVFCMLNQNGAITHVNDQFVQASGRSREALISTPLVDVMDAGNRGVLTGDVLPAMMSGTPWKGTIVLHKTDGKAVWLQCSFIPITDGEKQLREIAIVASDMTKTREGVSEARFNNTLELLQDHVVVFQPQTYAVMYANASVARHLMRHDESDDWRGKSLSDLIGKRDYDSLRERCAGLIKGPERRVTWEVEAKSGITYDISLEYVCPAQDEPRFIAIYRDVSQRKVAEKAKTEFLSTVSHELRTPLTSIKGALGLVLSGATGQLPDKMKGLITIAASSCDRLILLINSILDMEKIETGTLDFRMKTLNLSETLNTALVPNQLYAERAGVSLRRVDTPDDDVMLTYGDSKRLVQVLDNLLSNAVKFSEHGGEILIALHAVGDQLRISIRDFGTGIQAAAQASVFEKFTQGDSSDSRSKGGTGLGLTIAKVIIDHHQGQITFFSREDVGTEIIISLPRLAQEDAPAPDTPVQVAPPTAFSAALEQQARKTPSVIKKTAAEHLVQQITRAGYGPEFELGKADVGRLAAGVEIVGAPLLNKWITQNERDTLSQLIGAGAIADAAVCVIEAASDTDHSAAGSASTAVAQLRAWFATCAEPIGNPAQPLTIAAVDHPDVASWLETESIVTFDDTVDLAKSVATSQADVVLTFAINDGSASVMAVPTSQGLMPSGWPVCVLVIRNVENKNSLGVVSKFSSGR